MSDVERFAFCFARTYLLPARAFGISPTTAFVDVGDGELDAHFGPWRVSTPLANITDVTVTGPYAFLKTAGPARLAITDRGLTGGAPDERYVTSFTGSAPRITPASAGRCAGMRQREGWRLRR